MERLKKAIEAAQGKTITVKGFADKNMKNRSSMWVRADVVSSEEPSVEKTGLAVGISRNVVYMNQQQLKEFVSILNNLVKDIS
jgi:hypothetical protein